MTKTQKTPDFLQRLKAAGIIDETPQAAGLLADVATEATADRAAALLVEGGLLTKFQARVLVDCEDIPLSIGEYRVTDMLGKGGMGYVLKARHKRMQRDVAIKFLRPELTASDELRRRFDREVRTAAQLHHQNIVTAYDAGEYGDGSCYLVMQLVEGEDLSHLVKRLGPLSIPKTVDVIRQTAEGLAFAHEKGIVHRDIKPGNLLLDNTGVVRILDLGLARMRPTSGDSLEEATESDLTATGIVVGTVDYMAPEQAFDSKAADQRADIYSLGCTLYYLLTGTPPYRGSTVIKRLFAHREMPIPSLCAISSKVPRELDDILQRMLAKDPIDRFTSMRHLVEVLKSVPLTGLDHTPISEKPSAAGPQIDETMDRADEVNATCPLPLAQEQIAGAKPISGAHLHTEIVTSDRTPSGKFTETATFNPNARQTDRPLTSNDVFQPTLSRGTRLSVFVLMGVIVLGAVLWMQHTRKQQLEQAQREQQSDAPAMASKPTETNSLSSQSPDGAESTESSGVSKPVDPEPLPETPQPPVSQKILSAVEVLTSDEFEWSEPENLGALINSEMRESSPVLTVDEKLMLFSRNYRIWQAQRASADVPFETAEAVSSLASEEPGVGHGISMTRDGLVLVFTSQSAATSDDIMICTRRALDEPFSEPQRLPEPTNTAGLDRTPSLSGNGLNLWLTSTRSNQRNGDIFQFARDSRDVPFTNAIAVGPDLNTVGWDIVDSVTNDGLGLIKTEQGTPSRCLLYVRKSLDEPFSNPRPLGSVPMSKPYVSVDGQRIYFHSRNLPNSFGELDIYVIRRVRKAVACSDD